VISWNGKERVARGRDPEKDQSYMLWGIPDEAVPHLRLPLGELDKATVRGLASEAALETAERPDSQEICFVPDGDYGAFLDEKLREAGQTSERLESGDVVTADGRVVGRHRGVARYTIGQRRGLGVSLGVPAYVIALDPARNRVVVGGAEDLLATRAVLRDVRWAGGAEPEEASLRVQLRSRHRAAPAALRKTGAGTAILTFESPQRAVTPGQSAVFYEDDVVLGGGIVADAAPEG
jgi:tRNA-specific 2-thiouridylase